MNGCELTIDLTDCQFIDTIKSEFGYGKFYCDHMDAERGDSSKWCERLGKGLGSYFPKLGKNIALNQEHKTYIRRATPRWN